MRALLKGWQERAFPAVTPSPPLEMGDDAPRRDKSVGLAVALAALAISLFWGANIVALKIGLSAFPPSWGAFWRMGVGAVMRRPAGHRYRTASTFRYPCRSVP